MGGDLLNLIIPVIILGFIIGVVLLIIFSNKHFKTKKKDHM